MEQARIGAIGKRFLGNQFFGEMEVELRDKHSTNYKVTKLINISFCAFGKSAL